MKSRIFFLCLMLVGMASLKAEEAKKFFPNGQLQSEIKEDKQITYFDNGQINMETPLVNGVAEGLGKIYYADGKVMNEIEYKKGEPVYVKQYYPSGKLMREDDRIKKTWKQYDEEGKLAAEGES